MKRIRWISGTKLDSNLEFNWIWTLRFFHSIIHVVQKLEIRWDMWHKIENSIKNLIGFLF